MNSVNILLVEDEQISALDIKEMIESIGYNVVDICDTSNSALNAVEDEEIDLILMDIFLQSEKDGVETTREIKEDHDIPVMYLTAYSDEETLERARGTQPAGFLVKPITKADLKASIEMALADEEGNVSPAQ